MVGGIGLIEDVSKIATLKGAQEGDQLIVLGGDGQRHMGAGLYARVILGVEAGGPPNVDLDRERTIAAIVRELIAAGAVHAVHDVSEGGVLVAAAEMGLAANLGVQFDDDLGGPLASVCFSEDQAQYVLAVDASGLTTLGALARKHAQRFCDFGKFGGTEITVASQGRVKSLLPLSALRAAHEDWLPKYMSGEA